MARDTVGRTFLVAAVLCIVCSILVSGAAVALKEKQDENAAVEKKKNILVATGLCDSKATPEEVKKAYEAVQEELIDLDTGLPAPESIDRAKYDSRTAARDPALNVNLPKEKQIAGFKQREKYAFVYKVLSKSGEQLIVFPVYGKGLWSTLYGFLAVSSDLRTVKGLTFYQHGETPGLGGEVDNSKWKALWPNKQVFGPDGKVRLEVIKGNVHPDSPNKEHQVDGLSGATITSRGVTMLIRYWIGDAFSKYIEEAQKRINSPRGV